MDKVTIQLKCIDCDKVHVQPYYAERDNAYWEHYCKPLGRHVGVRVQTGTPKKKEVGTGQRLGAT